MNSLSKKYKNNDCTSLTKNNLPYDCCISKLILKSGKSVSTLVQLPLVPGTPGTPVKVANVTVDTLCLDDPEVKLDFTFTITNPSGATITNLTFQTFKLCKNIKEKVPVGNAWVYNDNFIPGTNAVFSFFVCDHNAFKSKCCTYIVEATPYS
ncbi:DUF4489 domain-containing protein [Clostridium psychrophilum]|uniref:DUF4489 domain-containing protein n=1 Tax=Clostridium psychrophilum TaxID=132926 RepID=UPI001C0CE76F|nr:DUF4489 domain-containing protein [Clostridium psychrophilum]MBU3179973.1 DUF4489 domain-containing protein [Clostridium psychrophilum]